MDAATNQDSYEFRRKNRISCLIKILISWFSLLAVIIIGMVFIRSNVERNPEAIDAYVSDLFELEIPSSFKAYSMSSFFRAVTISYWDQNHLNEEGRTSSIIAMYSEKRWNELDLEDLKAQALPKLKARLERNSFHTDVYDVITEQQGNQTIEIHRFRGQTRMDETLVPGTTCFRYVMTHEGPFQIQTMGFDSDFPEAAQVAFLRSLVPKTKPNTGGSP